MKLAKKLFFILLIASLAAAVAYFYRVNDTVISLDFVFYKFEEVSIGSMAVLVFLAGIVFTVLLTFIEIVVGGGREFKLKRENKKLKKEIASLKKQYEPEETEQEIQPGPVEKDEAESDEDQQ